MFDIDLQVVQAQTLEEAISFYNENLRKIDSNRMRYAHPAQKTYKTC
jgi:prefoldin subunit 5